MKKVVVKVAMGTSSGSYYGCVASCVRAAACGVRAAYVTSMRRYAAQAEVRAHAGRRARRKSRQARASAARDIDVPTRTPVASPAH